jgi:AraC-like DNA-binding protein
MHDATQFLHQSPHAAMRVIAAGPYAAPQGRDFPPHQHVTWEIIYYRAGHITCPIGDRSFEGRPGMLNAIPPRTIHAEIATTEYANFWIQLDAPADSPWPLMCMDDADQTLGHVCTAIVRESRAQHADCDEMLALLLHQLDLLLRRAQQHLPGPERLVREVESILETEYAKPLTFSTIARDIGVSPSHLRAQFVRLRGYPPKIHLQNIRVREALALLWNSTLTLEAIAGLCGYDSASHLSRHVKRTTGKSPGALRQRA